jgi:predicted GH43/DUF377 family glycosyl hydrolase
MSGLRWRSLGLIFQPDLTREWMRSHAQLPTPLQIESSVFRVFFASRDEKNRSHISWFDVDLQYPSKILRQSDEPVLTPGLLGRFDADGIYPASVVRDNTRVLLYTIGWNAGLRPPMFYASIGLAYSNDNGETFVRHGNAPIMARSEHDPCLVTSPVVLREGPRWRMWYVSGYRWEETSTGLSSHYHIKYAESEDGVTWRRDGHVCIAESTPDETNIGRCCIVKHEDRYRAWYSYARGGHYRIGYAESTDGLCWVRKDDQVEFRTSGQAWDAEAQAYPYVVRYGERWYMFYNGNGYGRDGIGLAVAED